MANTYHQIYLHIVFVVKYRQALLDKRWRSDLFAVIGNLINEANCKTIIVNGVEDHVHCLLSLRPVVSVSELMKTVKAKSSKYINDHRLTPHRFEWQEGFGAFSCSQSHMTRAFHYIKNQEAHHSKQNMREEYEDLLKAYQVTYDSRYLFQDPE